MECPGISKIHNPIEIKATAPVALWVIWRLQLSKKKDWITEVRIRHHTVHLIGSYPEVSVQMIGLVRWEKLRHKRRKKSQLEEHTSLSTSQPEADIRRTHKETPSFLVMIFIFQSWETSAKISETTCLSNHNKTSNLALTVLPSDKRSLLFVQFKIKRECIILINALFLSWAC